MSAPSTIALHLYEHQRDTRRAIWILFFSAISRTSQTMHWVPDEVSANPQGFVRF